MKKLIVSAIAAMAALVSMAGIDDAESRKIVAWFENAVTEGKAGWTAPEGALVYDEEVGYRLAADDGVATYTPVAHTGKAVSQLFTITPDPMTELPEAGDVQTAFIVFAGEEGNCFMAWAKTSAEGEAQWVKLGGTPSEGGDDIVLEIDYEATPLPTLAYYQGSGRERTKLNAEPLYVANGATNVTAYDFSGTGLILEVSGQQTATVALIINDVKYTAEEATTEIIEDALTNGQLVKVVDPTFEAPEGYEIKDGYLVRKQAETLPAADHSLNYNNALDTPSEILGGAALVSNGDGFDSYVSIRGGEETGVLSADASSKRGAYYNQSYISNEAAWTISIVAQGADSANGVIWSAGAKNSAPNTGLALVRKNAASVALVSWDNTATPAAVLIEAPVAFVDRQLHNYVVTCDVETKTFTLYVDGVAAGTKTVEELTAIGAGFQVGGVHGGNTAGLLAGAGFVYDELGIWTTKALTAEQVELLAANYPVYPAIRTLVWDNTKTDWTDGTQAYAGEELVTIGEDDTIIFRNCENVIYDKRTNKTALDLVVEAGTLKIGHDGENGINLVDGSQVQIAEGAKVRLQCWDNVVGTTRTVNLGETVTFIGPGTVEVEEHILTVSVGTIAGDAAIDLGNATVTITGTIAAPISGNATIPAYAGMTFGEGWTGTVQVPATESMANFNPNAYGTEKSTVEIAGIAAGHPAKVNMTTSPKIKLTGDVVFDNGYGGYTCTFAELSGTGNFSVSKERAPNQNYVIGRIKDYSGALKATTYTSLKINAVVVAAEPTATTTVVAFAEGTDLTKIDITETTIVLADGTDITDSVTIAKTEAGLTIAPQTKDWPTDPESVKGQTAGEAFGETIPEELRDAPADKLAAWAKGVGAVDFASATTIKLNAFLLNVANTTADDDLVISATAEDLAAIMAGDISTIKAKYPNAKVTIVEVSLPGQTAGTKLYRIKLSL